MTTSVYYINGAMRVAMDIPSEGILAGAHSSDSLIPIVVVGDSSREIPYSIIKSMLHDNKCSKGEFILDLLLINGTGNRYLRGTIDPNGAWRLTTVDAGASISDEIHNRATILQYRFGNEMDSNVLTRAQVYAVQNGIPITRRSPLSQQ